MVGEKGGRRWGLFSGWFGLTFYILSLLRCLTF